MSAPATTHDLRCAELRDPLPSGPAPERCTCRSRNVVRLAAFNPRSCVVCGDVAAPYQVTPDSRSCREHLADVVDHHLDDWDGFAPITVARTSTYGGAA